MGRKLKKGQVMFQGAVFDREEIESGRGGCLTYFFTGNVGNCVMLPVWRYIGRLFGMGG